MYHPTTMGMLASAHRDQLVREARESRLAHDHDEHSHGDGHQARVHRTVGVVLSVLLALAALAAF